MYIEGIPAYLVKAMNRPQLQFEEIVLDHINVKRYVKGKAAWQPIDITLYDPVVPSGAQAVLEWIRLGHESVTGRDGYSDFYKKDVTFNWWELILKTQTLVIWITQQVTQQKSP